MPPTSSAVASRRLSELLVHHHGADAVVRDTPPAAARRPPRTGRMCDALHAASAGLDAVLQVEGGVGGLRVGGGQREQALLGGGQRQLGVDRRCLRLGGAVGSADAGHLGQEDAACRPAGRWPTLVATSSMVRLKASPVGEKPKGDSSTMAPMSIARGWPRRPPCAPGRCAGSPPRRRCPPGRAVRKLPDATRTVESAMGVLGRPCAEGGLDLVTQLAGGLLRAVQRHRVGDAHAVAECARRGPWRASCSLTWGRKPCTNTIFTPMALHNGQVLGQAAEVCRRQSLHRQCPPRRSGRGTRGCKAQPSGTRARRCEVSKTEVS